MNVLVFFSMLGSIILAAACGDSGSGGSSETGGVALVLMDAPTDEFLQVLVTVTRIDLLPGEGDEDDEQLEPQTIFEGRETFDLLSLENVSEPFAVADDIPVGIYSKLRMEVEEIELVRMDGEEAFESVFPKLPGGDRIDLNSRGGFFVAPGVTLVIRIDVDARNSIHINETGTGDYIFRPQVFVEIMNAELPGRLIFVEGIVREIESAESSAQIWLCEVAISHRDRDGLDDEHCLTVFGNEETCVFDESGLPSDLSAIDVGDRIGVLGKFIHDDEDRFAIDAEVIELGGSESFVSLTGVASSDYDAEAGTILVDLDPGQGDGLDSTIVVEVAEETKSFSADGEPVDPEAIVVGTRLEVDGVLELSSDSPDLIRAAVIFVSEIATPDEI
jgi:hypothetical protein